MRLRRRWALEALVNRHFATRQVLHSRLALPQHQAQLRIRETLVQSKDHQQDSVEHGPLDVPNIYALRVGRSQIRAPNIHLELSYHTTLPCPVHPLSCFEVNIHTDKLSPNLDIDNKRNRTVNQGTISIKLHRGSSTFVKQFAFAIQTQNKL